MWPSKWLSDEIEERWEPEWSDADDSSRRSRSRRLKDSADGLDKGAREAAFAADRKLLVEGGWRRL